MTRLYFEQYQDNTDDEKHIFVYHSGTHQGVQILIELDEPKTEVNAWIPQLRKTRRFVTFDKTESWNGSNFTYGEMMLVRPTDETHQMLDSHSFTTNARGLDAFMVINYCQSSTRDIIKIKSTPKDDTMGYDYRVSYVDQDSFHDKVDRDAIGHTITTKCQCPVFDRMQQLFYDVLIDYLKDLLHVLPSGSR